MERPAGIAAIVGIFFLASAYVLGIGMVMRFSPGTLSMALGAPVLGGLESAGPYMFLATGAIGAVVSVGLWRLHNWARWAAIIVALIGIVMLIPSVSAAAVEFHSSLAWGGLGIIVRVIIVWYLFQEPVKRGFEEN